MRTIKMIRFFLKTALALLAEWFCYKIATPEMRIQWAKDRLGRRIGRNLLALVPVSATFHVQVMDLGEDLERFAKTLEEKEVVWYKQRS
jgi:hypothetical protein